MIEDTHPIEKISKEKESEIENDLNIEKIHRDIKEAEARLGKEISSLEREKLIKEKIKEHLQQLQTTPASASPVQDRDETEEISQFEPSQQIGTLIAFVFEKKGGLKKAISIARNLDNPAILDEFHDTLIDRYYEELKNKGII